MLISLDLIESRSWTSILANYTLVFDYVAAGLGTLLQVMVTLVLLWISNPCLVVAPITATLVTAAPTTFVHYYGS